MSAPEQPQQPMIWIGGDNCNLLVITETGRWFYNNRDITDDAAMLRSAFLEYASAESTARRGRPFTHFVIDDRLTAERARTFLNRIARTADVLESGVVNREPKRLYTIRLTPPKP